MLKIGVTGGIGSGKTTVCQIFEVLGIAVFYADDVAKTLMTDDEVLVREIKAAFGEQSYSRGNILDRKYLATLIFNNPEKREQLNALVHPAVFRAMDDWASKQTSKYVVKEAALLFESGSYKQHDFNILVSAPDDLRIARIMQRDNISMEDVLRRIGAQMSELEKQKKADFLIYNSEEQFLIQQVLQLHQKFIEMDTVF